jgi:hypothetical protein
MPVPERYTAVRPALDPSSSLRTTTLGVVLAAIVASVAVGVTLWGAGLNVQLRPLDGVEGDLLFEASRIRGGLVLYTDPLFGAADYGAVPARYYVLYPPLWATFLSVWPAAAAAIMGRVVSSAAWWGLLAWLGRSARERCRVPAALAAAFVGGVYSLAEFGGAARPDAAALALAGIALARSVRRGEVDALAGGLFALAALTKPSVLGMGGGAIAACAMVAPRGCLRGAASAAGVLVVGAAVLQNISSGVWLAHLLAGTAQPFHFRLLLHHLGSRAQFFLLFLGLAALFAWRAARREDPARSGATIALGALAFSVAWSFVTFAKIGSAANYWMEPCVAAVIVFANVEPPELSRRAWLAVAVAVPIQALWTGVGSVRATLEAIDQNRAHSLLLERARATCGVGPGVLVVADEPGIEMVEDGRLVAHAFPLTHQVLRGRLAVEPWLHDLSRPEVGCVLTMHDRIERPLSEIDVDYDYFAPQVRAALFARFAPAAESAGWEVYAPRAGLEGDR